MSDKHIPVEISIWDIPSVEYNGKIYRIINSKIVKPSKDYIVTDLSCGEDYQDIIESIRWDELVIEDVSDIARIERLDSLCFLRKLSLIEGSISEIKIIEKLVNLENLDLSSNKIIKLNGLSGLFNLVELNLSNNMIENVSDLTSLLSLKRLNLDYNKIQVLDGELLPYGLEVISAKGNPKLRIKNFDRLWRLKEFKK